MTDTPFGGSAGLLLRLRPVRIDVADLRDVAEAVLPSLRTPGLRLDLVRLSGAGSLVVLEEDERELRVPLAELADDMTRAGVPPTREGLADALAAWVAHRPVTDRVAATTGVAVLDWADPAETAVGWRVVVRRGELAATWTPSPAADTAAVHRTRSSATARSHEIPLVLQVEGPVALWSHPDMPVLATAALVAPQRMLRRITAAGVEMADMHVVVTPQRPVACAGPAVAARLAGETTEASVTLAWPRLGDLPWL
jgi:hypothetical protein